MRMNSDGIGEQINQRNAQKFSFGEYVFWNKISSIIRTISAETSAFYSHIKFSVSRLG